MKCFVIGISLLLAGCSLTPTTQLDPEFLQQLPSTTEISDTPFIQQADYQCGPASLAMVLNHQGYRSTPEELASQVFTPKAQGSFPVEMDITVRRQGFISYPINNLHDLLHEVAVGNPVLVLQNLGVSWYPMWHFAVVIGYDLERRELMLRSGDLPRRITPVAVFDRTWQRSERWGRVVLPASRLPATAQLLDYVEVVNALERSGHQQQAITAYRSALSAWPDSNVVRFGLANSLLADQQTDLAIAEYQALLRQAPEFVAGWNNYAYALKTAGCNTQALAASRCATDLAPGDPNLRDTYQEMSLLPQHNHPACPAVHCP